MRILITGGSGFLGTHAINAALAAGHDVSAVSHGRPVARASELASAASGVDLADTERLRAVLRACSPEAVVHLAGFANVGWSQRDPATAIAVNTAGTASLLSAIQDAAPEAHVVLASTSEVYARSASPLAEDAPLGPESPYGLSKRFMEETAAYLAQRWGLSIGILRSFAHCGPGQGPAFAVSNFARQVAVAHLAGEEECVVATGRASTVRDLSDARDAVRAYVAAAERRTTQTLNIGRGAGHSTADVVAALGSVAGLAVRHVEDPALVRDSENPSIVADVRAAAATLDWRPEIPLEQTLRDAVAAWTQTLTDAPEQGGGIFG